MEIFSTIQNNKFLVFSIVGMHAGEVLAAIFTRKQNEIEDAGKSIWLIKSFRAKTIDLQKIGQAAVKAQQEIYCLFISPAQTNGARPTSRDVAAKQYSEDGTRWLNIPEGIRTTGKIESLTTGLVLDRLYPIENKEIDLWGYSDFRAKDKPILLSRGASTVCAVKKYQPGMKSRTRQVVGAGRLTPPFAVYLR